MSSKGIKRRRNQKIQGGRLLATSVLGSYPSSAVRSLEKILLWNKSHKVHLYSHIFSTNKIISVTARKVPSQMRLWNCHDRNIYKLSPQALARLLKRPTRLRTSNHISASLIRSIKMRQARAHMRPNFGVNYQSSRRASVQKGCQNASSKLFCECLLARTMMNQMTNRNILVSRSSC